MSQTDEQDELGLESSLLEGMDLEGQPREAKKESVPARGVGIVGGISNLTKCVLGAGLLAIPRAFALLGVVGGSVALLSVSMLTLWTIKHGLVAPSVNTAGFLRFGTYSSMVNHWLGKKAEKILIFMMLLGGLGFEASCFDIIADILLGTPHNPGLLSTVVAWFCKCHVYAPAPLHATPAADSLTDPAALLSSSHSTGTCALHTPGLAHFWLTPSFESPLLNETDLAIDNGFSLGRPWQQGSSTGTLNQQLDSSELPAWAWMLDRRLVLLQVLVVIILPLSLKRHMGSLTVVNGIGLASLFAFAVSLVWLAVAALHQGVAHSLPLVPAYQELGAHHVLRGLHAFGVLSVLLTATACHGNVHPLMAIVTPFRQSTVNSIALITMSICSVFYLAISVCALLVFGPGVHENVLTNLSVPAMAPLVGPLVAQVMSVVLRGGYMVSVMGSAMLNLFPLRQAAADLLLGPPPQQTAYVHEHEPIKPSADAVSASGSTSAGSLKEPLLEASGSTKPSAVNKDGSSISIGVPQPCKSDELGYHAVVLDLGLEEAAGEAWQEAVRRHASRRASLHVPLTLGMLLVGYVLAVAVPSIWVALSLVGSVSITCVSFMMPAAVGLCALRHIGRAGGLRRLVLRASLWLTAVLGALMFVNGFVALYMDHVTHKDSKE